MPLFEEFAGDGLGHSIGAGVRAQLDVAEFIHKFVTCHHETQPAAR